MAFTVEMVITGLGVLQLTGDKLRCPKPSSVEFLPLKYASMDAMPGMAMETMPHPVEHRPVLSFCLSDLAGPDHLELPVSVGMDGALIVSKDISSQQVQLEVDGTATSFDAKWAADPDVYPPASGDRYALDWIPSAKYHLGLDNVIGSDSSKAALTYASRVLLPPGQLFTRRLLLRKNGEVERWQFGDNGKPFVMAEQIVWKRTGVNRLRVSVDWPALEFDAVYREQNQEEAVVRLAVTCMPASAHQGRYDAPAHFGSFKTVNDPDKDPPLLRRYGANPDNVTSHAACPPIRYEIVK